MSMIFQVSVDFDANRAKERIEFAARAAQETAAAEALDDCNLYARKSSGELVESSKKASDLKEGLLVWDTPYARRVYYTGEPAHGANTGARLMWAHAAAALHAEKWLETSKKEFDVKLNVR